MTVISNPVFDSKLNHPVNFADSNDISILAVPICIIVVSISCCIAITKRFAKSCNKSRKYNVVAKPIENPNPPVHLNRYIVYKENCVPTCIENSDKSFTITVPNVSPSCVENSDNSFISCIANENYIDKFFEIDLKN